MRVLVIHTTYKLRGGEDTVVANEVELLRSVNVEVDVLQFSNAHHTLWKVIQLPFNYSSYVRTKERIRDFKPDIVHIHNLHFAGSPSVIYAIKKCKVPFVLTLHNYRLLCPSATLFVNGSIFTDSLTQAYPWNAVLKGVYLDSKLLTFWVSCSMIFHQLIGTWKYVDKFIALGQDTKKIFSRSTFKFIEAATIVKPNFCYTSSSPKRATGKYYLYVGRLSIEKGVNLLLTAFSESGLPLKIIGTGPMEQEVISASAKYPNIQFMGVLDKKFVNEQLADATALIFPSQWFETFGMVIIEAFAAGVPIIASDIGQLKFTIKQHYNGLRFEAGNVTDLKDKINLYERLKSTDKLLYRENAFVSYQEYYTPQKNVKQLMRIYKLVLKNALIRALPAV
ncbi:MULTISPECIES: glycosyltransferase [unclassified Mucilaginibacter]|uniref:glycosyltransferase n=1 Tax=unclassified Mucilaginibacter TaxID=2617802 RepID=UPI002AC9B09C|nr:MULTISPECIES: glycosyltransferase [unclassified Mucilaginibacter]MEB0261133.1 glycosyltransferase [Mucilaginibacter sp. 10I4]MEB0280508.1 glycosyltransferase [Mucilaginibacter sp. 10B2]MEB0301286.1 glycosyltransferase [Mucilaginibacter sp. 5C4]WPX22482.1 glycosyltransferase [Mucilaginibacter sp. 5C4]